jgi:hypothetical protein
MNIENGPMVWLGSQSQTAPKNDGSNKRRRRLARTVSRFTARSATWASAAANGIAAFSSRSSKHLKTARQPDLLSGILRQTGDLRRRWHSYFFDHNLKPIERSLRRSQLARILQFYADRAVRHRLSSQAHERFRREIDQLVLALTRGLRNCARGSDVRTSRVRASKSTECFGHRIVSERNPTTRRSQATSRGTAGRQELNDNRRAD